MAVEILMVAPEGFDVRYQINPWMAPARWASQRQVWQHRARVAFDELRGQLQAAGARLHIVPGHPDLPDMVFPANAAIVLNDRVLLGRFRYPQRQGEEAEFARWFEQLRHAGRVREVAALPPGCWQEGAGDCLWDGHRQCFWGAFGPRSRAEALPRIAEFFGQRVIPLQLVSERCYHLDVAFCPLPTGDVLWFPPAFSSAAQAQIVQRTTAEQRIALTEDELARFNANAVAWDRHIVVSSLSPRLRQLLEARGYTLHEVDLSPFMLAGGAACCMTLRLDHAADAIAQPVLPESARPATRRPR